VTWQRGLVLARGPSLRAGDAVGAARGCVWARGAGAGLGLCCAPWPGRAVRWGRRAAGGEVGFRPFPSLGAVPVPRLPQTDCVSSCLCCCAQWRIVRMSLLNSPGKGACARAAAGAAYRAACPGQDSGHCRH